MEVNGSSFELAVIGGGPAGTSAAITAARAGVRVALFDGSDFPRQKVCGEFVSAESLELLGDLVRDHPQARRQLRNAPVIARARILASGRIAETAVNPAALSLPRAQLDLLLWEAACQSGVSAFSKCDVLSLDGAGPFRLTTAQGQVSASAIIVCAGRWSRFSDASLLPTGPKWIGLKAHFRERNPPPSSDLYFFRNGYCGVQPVGENAVNVCAMVRSDVASELEAVIALVPSLARRAALWEPLFAPLSTAPLFYREPEPLRGNLLLAGDAAAFIDPFAGDGISLALRSGKAAADCLHAFFAGQASLRTAAQKYRATYEREFAPLISVAARARRLHRLPQFTWPLAMQVLRLPGVLPYMARRTRVV